MIISINLLKKYWRFSDVFEYLSSLIVLCKKNQPQQSIHRGATSLCIYIEQIFLKDNIAKPRLVSDTLSLHRLISLQHFLPC